jgi:hypothetical protein
MPVCQPKADLMLQNAVTRQIFRNRVHALGLIKRFDLSSRRGGAVPGVGCGRSDRADEDRVSWPSPVVSD